MSLSAFAVLLTLRWLTGVNYGGPSQIGCILKKNRITYELGKDK